MYPVIENNSCNPIQTNYSLESKFYLRPNHSLHHNFHIGISSIPKQTKLHIELEIKGIIIDKQNLLHQLECHVSY
jgi:hypothetical protein